MGGYQILLEHSYSTDSYRYGQTMNVTGQGVLNCTGWWQAPSKRRNTHIATVKRLDSRELPNFGRWTH